MKETKEIDRLLKEEARRARRRVPLDARRRSVRACEPCRWRKTKCSGGSPCDECQRRKARESCCYSSETSRRRLEDVGIPRGRREAQSPNENCGRQLVLQLLHHGEMLDPDLRNLLVGYLQGMESSARTRAQETDVGENSDETHTEEETVESDITQLLSDRQGELRYVGEAGFLSFLEQVRRYVVAVESRREQASSTSSGSITSSGEARSADSTEKFVSGSYQKEIDDNIDQAFGEAFAGTYLMCMGRDEMKRLFRLAERGNPLVRLLFSASDCEEWIGMLDGRCAEDAKTPEASRRRTLGRTAVVYLVLSLGLLYAPNTEAGRQYDQRAVALMESAFRIMRTEMLAEHGGLLAVQAFGLATVACLTVCKRHAAWIYLGISIRCAQALGLHRRVINLRFTTKEQIARTRLWWVLYLLDSMISTAHGRPLAIEEEYCDDFAPDDIPSDVYRWEGPWLALMVRITRLHGRIQRTLYYRGPGLSVSHIVRDAQKMFEELEEIQKEIPDELSLQRLQTDLERDLQLALLQLHLEYFSTYQHLTRLFFLASLMNTVYGRHNVSHAISAMKEIKIFADASPWCAGQTIDLVWNLFERDLLPRRCPSLVHNIFVAGLVLSTSIYSKISSTGNVPPDDKQQIQRVTNCLKLLRYFWKEVGDITSERFYSVLAAFQEDLRVGHQRPQPENGSSISESIASLVRNDFGSTSWSMNTSGSTDLDASNINRFAAASELFTNYYDQFGSSSSLMSDMTGTDHFPLDNFPMNQWSLFDAPGFNF